VLSYRIPFQSLNADYQERLSSGINGDEL
jgi:hypothetical protein